MNQILLIEDDKSLGSTLTENLTLEGYEVHWVTDGVTGLQAAQKQIHDLIILDVMLPKLSGLELLQELRKSSKKPVLMISAKGSPQDRIAGLELFADDYLPKPFHLKELLLRIQSLLRRTLSEAPVGELKIGRAHFHLKSLSVTTDDGQNEKLSDKEARVLSLLVTKSNQVVSRDEILNTVWGYDQYPSSRTVDNFIVKLRKFIEQNPAEPALILSHRGAGYLLKLPESAL